MSVWWLNFKYGWNSRNIVVWKVTGDGYIWMKFGEYCLLNLTWYFFSSLFKYLKFCFHIKVTSFLLMLLVVHHIVQVDDVGQSSLVN